MLRGGVQQSEDVQGEKASIGSSEYDKAEECTNQLTDDSVSCAGKN